MLLDLCILIIATRRGGKKRKGATSGKAAASAAPSEPAPKRKKLKVLTHRPRYIEPAIVPEFGEGTSSTTEAKQVASIVQSAEESIVMLKVPTIGPAETKDDTTEESKVEETVKMSEILSPPAEANLSKMQKGLKGN